MARNFASFKPAQNSSIYFSYAESLESGSQAPVGRVNAFEQLPPAAAEQIELGAKFEFTGLLVTTALFEIDRPLEIVNSQNRFVQDGRQTHRGVELQAQGQIGGNLSIVSGVTWLDAEIANGDPAVSGNQPVGVPEFSSTLFLDYDLPFLAGASLNGGLIYEDQQYYDLTNERSVDAWTRVDVGGSYRFSIEDGQDLIARFAVTNFLDEGYWTVDDFSGLSLSAPRTYSLSLTAAF